MDLFLFEKYNLSIDETDTEVIKAALESKKSQDNWEKNLKSKNDKIKQKAINAQKIWNNDRDILLDSEKRKSYLSEYNKTTREIVQFINKKKSNVEISKLYEDTSKIYGLTSEEVQRLYENYNENNVFSRLDDILSSISAANVNYKSLIGSALDNETVKKFANLGLNTETLYDILNLSNNSNASSLIDRQKLICEQAYTLYNSKNIDANLRQAFMDIFSTESTNEYAVSKIINHKDFQKISKNNYIVFKYAKETIFLLADVDSINENSFSDIPEDDASILIAALNDIFSLDIRPLKQKEPEKDNSNDTDGQIEVFQEQPFDNDSNDSDNEPQDKTINLNDFLNKKAVRIIVVVVAFLFAVAILRSCSNHRKVSKEEKASIKASVEYKEEHNEIDLSEIKNLSVAKDDSIEESYKSNNNGEIYDSTLSSGERYSMVTYDLGGKYDTFTGSWDVREYSAFGQEEYFYIIVDGENVYTSPKITKDSEPENVKVDLKFGRLMTIVFVSDGAAICDPKLSCSDKTNAKNLTGQVTAPAWLKTSDPIRYDDGVYYDNYEGNSNVADIAIHHYITADTTTTDDNGNEIETPRNIEYVLEGKYKNLSGIWALTEDGKNTEKKQQFMIYADDKLVYTSDIIGSGNVPKEFSAEINNCQRLKIVFTKGDGSAALSSVILY